VTEGWTPGQWAQAATFCLIVAQIGVLWIGRVYRERMATASQTLATRIKQMEALKLEIDEAWKSMRAEHARFNAVNAGWAERLVKAQGVAEAKANPAAFAPGCLDVGQPGASSVPVPDMPHATGAGARPPGGAVPNISDAP